MSKLKNFTRLGWVWLLPVAVISLHDGYLHAVGMSESPWTLVPQVKAVKVGEGHYKKAKNFYSPNPAHFFFNICPIIRCNENWAAKFSKIGSTFCHIQNNKLLRTFPTILKNQYFQNITKSGHTFPSHMLFTFAFFKGTTTLRHDWWRDELLQIKPSTTLSLRS